MSSSAPPHSKKAAPPPLPLGASMLAAAVRSTPDAVDLEPAATPPPPPRSWFSWVLGSKVLLWGGIPAAGIAAMVVLWLAISSSRNVQTQEQPTLETASEPTVAEKIETPQAAKPAFARLDNRWMPNRTHLVIDLRLAQLAGREEFDRVVRAIDPGWRPSVGRLLKAFGLAPKAVHRLTWASTDLRNWRDRAVAVIKLEEGQKFGGLATAGEAVGWQINGNACRRLPQSEWPHPFAILGDRTIVTGPDDLLKELATRTEARLDSRAISRLLTGTAPDAEVVFLLDLAAARDAGWKLPVHAMDVWPAGQRGWRAGWELPVGIGFALRRSDRLSSEVALLCEGETTAVKVHEALSELAPAAKQGLAARDEALLKRLQAGQITGAQATAYQTLLKQAQNTLQSAHWDLAEDIVWIRIDSMMNASGLALAALDNTPAIMADWLAAARAADELNQRGLLASLDSYQKAEHRFPAGAEGGAMLPPETRLSWIASMLPYFGHLDWHRELQFGYPWNAAQNRPVAQRPLEKLVNPALGPSKTESGFPVTHYVGVSGVGPDAGNLKADHPQAGVFGYGRTVRLDSIGDGASNTIATLGASQRLGAWAAGGDATVRALTKRPYVNGPDGFGSGQPDGMLAGMADGSVRFISKSVDPVVLEQLATMNGREPTTAAALVSKPAAPSQPEEKKPAPIVPETERPRPEQASKPAASAPSAPSMAVATKADTAEKKAPTDKTPEGDPTEQKAEPVDVQARLADRVADVEFSGTPLAKVVEFLSKLSTLPISYDLEAMAQLGARLSDPVSVHVTGGTIEEILKKALATRGLVPVVVQDQVLVTAPPAMRAALRTARYNVSDLAGSDLGDEESLAAAIRRLVAPESWRQAGGQGSVTAAKGTLTVDQSDFVHYQVLMFCDRLRTARGVPPTGSEDRERSSLATRLDRIRPRLRQPISINFEPTSLATIVSELSETGRTPIVIDWLTLREEGISPQVQGTLKVQNRPLSESLGTLLRPLGLACRIVQGGLLEITGRKALNARFELEFYPVGDLTPKAITSAALIERIKSEVGGATWNDAGGAAVLHFDGPSRTLVVLQSQPAQIAIQALLADLRNKLLTQEPKK